VNASNKDEVVLLFAGRLTTSKGAHLLPHILFDMLFSNPSIIFIIAGDGDVKKQLQDSVKMRKLNNVVITEWIDQERLYNYYMKSDIIIIPSIYPDNFPLVCMEAMAFGKPVVTFAVGGLPELVKDGYNGYLVKLGDIENMKQKIEDLVKNKEQRTAMGEEARNMSKAYHPSVIVPRIQKVYKESITVH
jgi:glycosyltransferase involved in cell wall biosynthesis